MNQLQQVQNMLQSYQSQMNQLQQMINGIGKAPAQVATQPVAVPNVVEAETGQLTAEQHSMLLDLFKAFVGDEKRDGAKELSSGLMKFGRYAQSEFDKLAKKP